MKTLIIIWGLISIYSACIQKYVYGTWAKDKDFVAQACEIFDADEDIVLEALTSFTPIHFLTCIIPIVHIVYAVSFSVVSFSQGKTYEESKKLVLDRCRKNVGKGK